MVGSSWLELAGVGLGLCSRGLKKAAYAGLTCAMGLGGALIGAVSGALKGQTTETGLFRGAAIGMVAGAVVAFEVLDSCLQGDLLSKVSILDSLINGRIFREWVSPAMLKAYQWQINTPDLSEGYISDIFDTDQNDGLSLEIIEKLPVVDINNGKSINLHAEASCAVCLQDLKGGQSARRLPACGHFFHIICIDSWLLRHASCPICRHDMQDSSKLDTAIPGPTNAAFW